MFKKIMVVLLLISTFLFSTPNIRVDFDMRRGNINVHTASDTIGQKDWIAIYPKNASNDWNNVITWAWVKDLPKNGNWLDYRTKKKVTKFGHYEVRYFENNSFTTYKAFDFTIKKPAAILRTIYTDYHHNDGTINIYLDSLDEIMELNNNKKDWIGIYKKGDSNAWGNVITWAWIKDFSERPDFNSLKLTKAIKMDDGEYETRYFRNNSFTTYQSSSFRIRKNIINLDGINAISREPNKVTIYVVGVNGQAKPNPKDWIGIYKKGDSNDWKNVVTWVWVKDFISGPGDLPEEKYPEESRTTLKLNVNNEEYEARYFLNNSFTTYMKSKPFQVKQYIKTSQIEMSYANS